VTSLLDPDFLRRLGRLRLAVRRRFAGSSAGSRRSLRRGSSAEFAEHRPYYPGDDVRRIDWNAYARLEELVLRLYVAEEDLHLHLLLDRSASLGVGTPRKFDIAKQAAAAIGYVALSGSERVSVLPFGETLAAPIPSMRGQKRIGTLLRHLDALDVSGGTSFEASITRFLSRSPRPGVVVVVSDFLDPEGFSAPLDKLIAHKHEPVLIQVLDPEEVNPTVGHDVELVDSETGEVVDVSIDATTVAAYRRRLQAFFEELTSYAKKRGLFYGRIDHQANLDEVILAYLRGGAR
jgi:uncharacterized protein (DUF58 family)